jgi:hypothetical protein
MWLELGVRYGRLSAEEMRMLLDEGSRWYLRREKERV